MIRTTAAASILGVSTNTLRSWERRYGFPSPRRSSGGHRRYAIEEIQTLRQTLSETRNVSSAIALARRRGAGPASPAHLASALASLDHGQADRLLEESLALRSVERTVEEVLLPGVAELADPGGPTAEYELAWHYATQWLCALSRVVQAPSAPADVVIFDASTPCDLDALYTQALELMLRRAGVAAVRLTPAVQRSRLGRALRGLSPRAVVITGRRSSLDTIGRIVYTVRSMRAAPPVLDYRGAVAETPASTLVRLGEQPVAARDQLLDLLQHGSPGALAA